MKKAFYILLIFISNISVGQELLLLHKTTSTGGIHSLYLKSHEGLPVFNQQVKINQYRHSTKRIETLVQTESPDFSKAENSEILKQKSGYLYTDNQFIKVEAITFITDAQESYTFFYNNGDVVHHEVHHCFLKDTTVNARVFNPDPITSSGQVYSGDYVDNNDATNSSLDNELINEIVNISHDGDTFRLENEHIKITNHSSPDIKPTASINNNFIFDRSQVGFEEMNAIYHISRFAEYIKDTLNFPQIMNYQVHADVYALGASDNSQFINSTSPPRLNFGVGGIDDAEDADIIIHEYTHGITFSTAPGTLNGHERKAIDEGIGDYFAATYSKSINENNYKTIFNWDGHNEYWQGRSIDNSKKYPVDMENQIYKDGDLYASMLIKIRNSIPDPAADRIVLESTFNWFSNMTFKDAGEALLDADTVLYNGLYSPTIHWVLCERGFITENCSNFTPEITENTLIYQIHNQNLVLAELPSVENTLRIYDSRGRLLHQETNWQNTPISLAQFQQGMIIVNFEANNKVYNNRILFK